MHSFFSYDANSSSVFLHVRLSHCSCSSGEKLSFIVLGVLLLPYGCRWSRCIVRLSFCTSSLQTRYFILRNHANLFLNSGDITALVYIILIHAVFIIQFIVIVLIVAFVSFVIITALI